MIKLKNLQEFVRQAKVGDVFLISSLSHCYEVIKTSEKEAYCRKLDGTDEEDNAELEKWSTSSFYLLGHLQKDLFELDLEKALNVG